MAGLTMCDSRDALQKSFLFSFVSLVLPYTLRRQTFEVFYCLVSLQEIPLKAPTQSGAREMDNYDATQLANQKASFRVSSKRTTTFQECTTGNALHSQGFFQNQFAIRREWNVESSKLMKTGLQQVERAAVSNN